MNPNHTAEQVAAQKAKGTYVPMPTEKLYDAMIPAFKAGTTKDEVRELIYAARCVHSGGTAIGTGDLEKMLEELMQQNLFLHDILTVAAIEKEGITTPIVVKTRI